MKEEEKIIMKFFNPTSELKELRLLQHIEENPDTTQHEIASVIGGAASMVNNYIDRLEKDNYMKREYRSVKTVFYNITPDGVKRKNYLAISYFHELLELSRLAKENIEKFLLKLEDKGHRRILVYGAGEVAETLLEIIKSRADKPLKVLAIIDDEKDRQKEELLGYKIISSNEIADYEHDVIVIASYTYEDDIRNRLEDIGYPTNKIVRFFSE